MVSRFIQTLLGLNRVVVRAKTKLEYSATVLGT